MKIGFGSKEHCNTTMFDGTYISNKHCILHKDIFLSHFKFPTKNPILIDLVLKCQPFTLNGTNVSFGCNVDLTTNITDGQYNPTLKLKDTSVRVEYKDNLYLIVKADNSSTEMLACYKPLLQYHITDGELLTIWQMNYEDEFKISHEIVGVLTRIPEMTSLKIKAKLNG